MRQPGQAGRAESVGFAGQSSPDQARAGRGGQSGTYQFAEGSAEGTWACYDDATGTSQMIWTSPNLGILASANARAQTPQQLNDWFFSPAETGPR